MQLAATAEILADESARALFRRITWRLAPFLFVCYVVNYIDRANVAMAQLQFKSDLGFSDAVYGFGAGLFFVGYLLFEVPSNLVLARIGARLTLMRIMILWGLVTALTMLMHTPTQYYIARMALGAAEAGLIPGVLLYLTYWFPSAYRAKVTGIFFLAVPVGSIIGNPLAGSIMQTADGLWGYRGWQWLFVLEGIPAVLLGVVTWFVLDDRPEHARWLTDADKAIVRRAMDAEEKLKAAPVDGGFLTVLRDPRTYILGYVLFTSFTLANLISFWAPAIIRNSGVRQVMDVGLLGAAPPVVGIICLLVAGWHSDRNGERRWHVAVPLCASAIGLALLPRVQGQPVAALAALALVVAGHYSTLPVIWSIPSDYTARSGAAGGIAFISCMGAVGGAFGPSLLGWAKDLTGSLDAGLLISAAVVFSGAFALLIGVPARALISRPIADRSQTQKARN